MYRLLYFPQNINRYFNIYFILKNTYPIFMQYFKYICLILIFRNYSKNMSLILKFKRIKIEEKVREIGQTTNNEIEMAFARVV